MTLGFLSPSNVMNNDNGALNQTLPRYWTVRMPKEWRNVLVSVFKKRVMCRAVVNPEA